MVAKKAPLRGSRNRPPMNSPYRGRMETMSRDSGAEAYCHGPSTDGLCGSRRSMAASLVVFAIAFPSRS
jgi:hypothetical protein